VQVQSLAVEVPAGVVRQKALEVLAFRVHLSSDCVTIPGRASGS
jgi:hypothetical protein